MDPNLDFQSMSEALLTLPLQTSKLLVQNNIVTSARFTCTCYGISDLAFRCLNMPGVTNNCGSTCNKCAISCTCYGISDLAVLSVLTHVRIALLSGYWGYLEPSFANEEIIGFHCHGATAATLGRPLPTSTPLDFFAMGLLGLPWGYICQRADHWIALLWGYWGFLGLPLLTSRSLDFTPWNY